MTATTAEAEAREAVTRGDRGRLRTALEREPSLVLVADFLVRAAGDSLACVELLLESGAPIDALNSLGTSALEQASTRGMVEIVRSLLARGASVDGTICGPTTALMSAALYGKLEVARLLVEAGADLDRDSLIGATSPLGNADEDAPFDQEARKEVAAYLRSVGATKPWDRERPEEFWDEAEGELTIRLVESCLGVVSAIPLHDELTEYARVVVRRARHGWRSRFQTLFTCGLPDQGSAYELALPLTAKWPLHRRALEQELFARPVKFLAAAADRALTGVKIEHGDVLTKEHPLVTGLAWPGDFEQWLVVDHSSFVAKREAFASAPEPELRATKLPQVLLLVPHLEKKPLKPGDEGRRKADAKARVKWEKPAASGGRNNLVVPLCYKPTWHVLGEDEGTWY